MKKCYLGTVATVVDRSVCYRFVRDLPALDRFGHAPGAGAAIVAHAGVLLVLAGRALDDVEKEARKAEGVAWKVTARLLDKFGNLCTSVLSTYQSFFEILSYSIYLLSNNQGR